MSLLTPRSVGEGQAWVLAQRMCGERYTPWRLQSFSDDTVGDEHFAIRHVEPEQWGDVEVCPKSRSCLVEQYTWDQRTSTNAFTTSFQNCILISPIMELDTLS